MEDQRKFALDDDMLDSVAGGTDDIGLMYDGWWLDTQIPCQETRLRSEGVPCIGGMDNASVIDAARRCS